MQKFNRRKINVFDDGKKIAELIPIKSRDLQDLELISNLTDWRRENSAMFLSSFQATKERTREWLEKIIASQKKRMLYLIYEEGNLIGQVGFNHLTAIDALIDNGMKGNISKNPRIMVCAHKAIIGWLFSTYGLNYVYGWVMADNIGGVMMNRTVGWNKWIKHPLIKSTTAHGTLWEIGDVLSSSPDKKYIYKIILEREYLKD